MAKKNKKTKLSTHPVDADRKQYLERIAEMAPKEAAAMVNKWSGLQRRLFCDSIMTSYFQAVAMRGIVSKSHVQFSDDVIRLIDKALQEVMLDVKINANDNDRPTEHRPGENSPT